VADSGGGGYGGNDNSNDGDAGGDGCIDHCLWWRWVRQLNSDGSGKSGSVGDADDCLRSFGRDGEDECFVFITKSKNNFLLIFKN